MKLPKGFGGQGFGNMMQQAKVAMERAKHLEEELEQDRIPVDKGPVKVVFDGTGKMVGLKIDKSVVDPEDVEALEDLIISASRDGFDTAVEIRNKKMGEITANIPGL